MKIKLEWNVRLLMEFQLELCNRPFLLYANKEFTTFVHILLI